MSDLDRERYRRGEVRPFAATFGDSDAPAFVGRVTSSGANIAVGKFLMVNFTDVFGAETEGGPGSFVVDSSRAWPVLLLGPDLPATGDYLVCRFVGNRWVAERFGPSSSCNATLAGTLNGCNFQGFPAPIPGIAWTATQSGSVVASGTTDSAGTIAAFVVHSTAPVTMTYAGLPARAGIAPYNVTPVCGSTVACGTSINLSGSGSYVCIAQRSYQANYCLYPIATTLYLTSPFSGALVSLVYVPSATLWAGSESYALTPNPCGGGVTPILSWVYYPDAGQLQCSYRCGLGGLVPIGSAAMGHTCPTATTGYSASGTYSDSSGVYGGTGNPCPISE